MAPDLGFRSVTCEAVESASTSNSLESVAGDADADGDGVAAGEAEGVALGSVKIEGSPPQPDIMTAITRESRIRFTGSGSHRRLLRSRALRHAAIGLVRQQ